jgi:ATP-dependent DNA helicase RecQ
MRDTFELLRAMLQGAAATTLRPDECADASHRRLLGVLHTLASGASVGQADLVALIRHVLRREQERQGGRAQSALVPQMPSWPTSALWKRAGFDVEEHSAGFARIQARRWQPAWLPGAEQVPPEQAAFAEDVRRNYAEVSGDPFLSAVGKIRYRSTGQRASVRAVVTTPPGATLVVNLPTGAGKSLCAHVPALLGSESHGVTIVVMPTTALCIDQENALRALVPHPTAHYGGASAEQRERNAEIRKRVANGTQRIVFTSPESLVGALSHAVYKAARAGLLRFLVIDEAHMVEQWGDEFRSAFQEVAGMRIDLLRNCVSQHFRTVLLTATLTESCLDTLETLFGRPGPFAVVSAVQLRPEPAYWHARCATEAEKQARVLDAVHHLPRPLILYVTRIRDANAWFERIRAAGYTRCDVVTGETPDERRREVLERWREGRTDIVVATSAFGLGVDKEDVRAVVHACVPENIDRYYQEVGRGGRDGRASLSLVIYTHDDLTVADGLNSKKIIGIDRGRERWCSMFRRKETTATAGRYRLAVDIPPSFELGDIDMVNDYNVAWNIRTLTLMARARMIELDADPPPSLSIAEGADPDVERETFEAAIVAYRTTRVVRVLQQEHELEQTWLAVAEPERKRARRFAQRSLELMRAVLEATQCVADVLAAVYTVGPAERDAHRQIYVARACGGCPHCRASGTRPFASPLPLPPPPWPAQNDLGATLRAQIGAEPVLGIFYRPPAKRRDERTLGNVLAWFANQGIRNFVVPPPYFDIAWAAFDRLGLVVFLSEQLDPGAALELPRAPMLILHPPTVPLPRDLYLHRPAPGNERSTRVLLLPASATDPERDDVPAEERFRYPNLRLEEFCARYSI